MDFIERLEDEVFAFIPELLGNLSPHGADLLKDLLLFRSVLRSILDVKPPCAVSSIVMHIDDHIQTGILCISDNLGHPVKPSILDLIFRSSADVSHPCHRDTHGLESGSLNLLKDKLGCLRVAPHCLSGYTIIICVKMVSHIPSHTQHARKHLSQWSVSNTFVNRCLHDIDRSLVFSV